MKTKQIIGYVKSINPEKKILTALISDYNWDRTDERFSKGSWKLDNYMKNPVVLWAHNNHDLPIAKAVNIREEESGLVADTQFDDQSQFAMSVFSLYQRGFLNAFSVGFRPTKHIFEGIEGTDRKGITWIESELLEFSAVPVPANPGALAIKELKANFKGVLDENDDLWKSMEEPKPEDPAPVEEQPKPENTKAVEPENNPQRDPDIVPTLKSLIDLAKIVKKDKLDDQKLELVKTSMAVLQDIINESTKGFVTKAELNDLKGIVDKCAEIIQRKHPDATDLVSKFMLQLEAALKSAGEE